MGHTASEHLAELLEAPRTTPPRRDLGYLVFLAEVLRRRRPARPDPAFRRRLLRRLLAELPAPDG